MSEGRAGVGEGQGIKACQGLVRCKVWPPCLVGYARTESHTESRSLADMVLLVQQLTWD